MEHRRLCSPLNLWMWGQILSLLITKEFKHRQQIFGHKDKTMKALTKLSLFVKLYLHASSYSLQLELPKMKHLHRLMNKSRQYIYIYPATLSLWNVILDIVCVSAFFRSLDKNYNSQKLDVWILGTDVRQTSDKPVYTFIQFVQ